MTRFTTSREFEEAYALSTGNTVEALHAEGRYGKPCDCTEDDCGGWYLAHRDLDEKPHWILYEDSGDDDAGAICILGVFVTSELAMQAYDNYRQQVSDILTSRLHPQGHWRNSWKLGGQFRATGRQWFKTCDADDCSLTAYVAPYVMNAVRRPRLFSGGRLLVAEDGVIVAT